jgi:pectate lyase
MKNTIIIMLLAVSLVDAVAQEITIQENERGFCSVDGIIDVGVAGYTGDGFANTDIGPGLSIIWSVTTQHEGTYKITWRYGNGGGAGDLLGYLLVNDAIVMDTVVFSHTVKWYNWTFTDTIDIHLNSGPNRIRLTAISANGLANIDYVTLFGDGLMADTCIASYKLTVTQNIEAGGTINFFPVQEYYDEGTMITVEATPADGYFFQSWSGTSVSTDSLHNFSIRRNSVLKAMFYPAGTVADTDIAGYATVQDDCGTPYLVTGGLGGDTVLAENFMDLANYLSLEDPYVVLVNGFISGEGEFTISSNKSLIGTCSESHIEGIRIKVSDAENVIIRNMIFSKVIRYDEIEVNGSHHLWIDGCEFYTDRDHDVDYYDGLLDIKNESSYITVSWSKFHDHHKAILISSGDGSVADSSIRITFHHNYFYNCGSRLPSLRFGKAHIFSNYYKNNDSGINSRMGACVKVENNYFLNSDKAIRVDQSAEPGNVDLGENIFESSTYVAEPVCVFKIPYAYSGLLENVNDIPQIIAGECNPPEFVPDAFEKNSDIRIFPNPAHEKTIVEFYLEKASPVIIMIYSSQGKILYNASECSFPAGKNMVLLDIGSFVPGMYIFNIKTDDWTSSKRIIVLK